MVRDFKAGRVQRMVSDVRYMRFMLPDIAAGIALVLLLLLLPIMAALL